MMFGTRFKQGDILIVPFPFSNLASVKQRPVLVISSNRYNKNSGDVIVCGLTSNLRDMSFSVDVDNGCLSRGRLPVKSRIKVDKLFTIDKRVVKKNIASVDDRVFGKVREEFFRLV